MLGCSLPANAQEAAGEVAWDMKVPAYGMPDLKGALKLKPAFYVDGDDLGTLERSDLQSEGEYSLEQRLRFGLGAGAEVSLFPRVAVSPHWFDDEDGSAAASVEFRLARSFGVPPVGDRPFDVVQAFMAYEPGWAWNGVFDDYKATDQKLSGGLLYVNRLSWLCGAGESRAASNCTGEKGLRWSVSGRWSRLESDASSRDYEGPLVEVRLDTPIGASSSASLGLVYERRDYSGRSPLGGADVIADRYVVEAGLNISRYVQRTTGLSDDYKVEIAFRWVTVDSNASDLQRDRLSVIPTLSREW